MSWFVFLGNVWSFFLATHIYSLCALIGVLLIDALKVGSLRFSVECGVYRRMSVRENICLLICYCLVCFCSFFKISEL